MSPEFTDRKGLLLIIGGQRCGSTLLARTLAMDSRIRLAGLTPPEQRFLLSDEDPLQSLRASLLTHESAVAGNVKWIGEKATTYLEIPWLAPRIRTLGLEPRVIVILRDPVIRAYSNYQFSTRMGFERLPVEEALTRRAEARSWDTTKLSTSPYHYLKRGEYSRMLSPWLQVFPDMQIMFLEELVAEPSTLKVVFEHLNLTQPPVPHRLKRVNASHLGFPPLPPHIAQNLRRHYQPRNQELLTMLDRDRLPWSS